MAKKKELKAILKKDLKRFYQIGSRALIIFGLSYSGMVVANQSFNSEFFISAGATALFYFFIEASRYKEIDTKKYKNFKPLIFP